MMRNMLRLASYVGLILMLENARPAAQAGASLPDGEGKALVAAVCTQCHDLTPLFVYSGDDRQWEIVVHDMIAFGAQVSPQERDNILAYLKASFSRTAIGRDGSLLPPGKGQEVLRASCGRCHGLPLIARKRADQTEWDGILRRHATEGRVELPPGQREALLGYLAEHFRRVDAGGDRR